MQGPDTILVMLESRPKVCQYDELFFKNIVTNMTDYLLVLIEYSRYLMLEKMIFFRLKTLFNVFVFFFYLSLNVISNYQHIQTPLLHSLLVYMLWKLATSHDNGYFKLGCIHSGPQCKKILIGIYIPYFQMCLNSIA